MSDMEESLTLSRDIKRACELLEKLQKSKYCGEVGKETLPVPHVNARWLAGNTGFNLFSRLDKTTNTHSFIL
jgi:hypothetical protein